ncbi:MAG: pentapeptide repeat-containing protein [Thermomicrobiales bacterium]
MSRKVARSKSRRDLLAGILASASAVILGVVSRPEAGARTIGAKPAIPTPPPPDPTPNPTAAPPDPCPGQIHCAIDGCCDGTCTAGGRCCRTDLGLAICGEECCETAAQCCDGECCAAGYACCGEEICLELGTNANCGGCFDACSAPETCGGGGDAGVCGCTNEPLQGLCGDCSIDFPTNNCGEDVDCRSCCDPFNIANESNTICLRDQDTCIPNLVPNGDLTGCSLGINAVGPILVGLNLAGADFRGADLLGQNFTNANLTGADFDNAGLFQATFGNTICPDGVNSDTTVAGDCCDNLNGATVLGCGF